MLLDEWQQKVLDTQGNICLRAGRQVGKSTIISIKAAEYAINNPKTITLIVASVERQAYLLFDKTLNYLYENYQKLIKKGSARPTKHQITLTNGSKIYSLPTGLSGYGIRGYTINLLIADEAAFIPEAVWTAITPMLAITKGKIILLSTPFGKDPTKYFYRCFSDPNFTAFHVSSEDCPRKDVEYLEREKARLSKVQYAQEYLGEFVEELQQFFPTDLIQKCMILPLVLHPLSPVGEFYLGVDVARMGGDETVLTTLECLNNKFYQKHLETSESSKITETILRIKNADSKFNYRKIYIDDGGLGVGVFDVLVDDEQTRRKIVAINNATRVINYREDKRKHLLKEDLYANLLRLMEQGRIKLFESPEVMLSLKSVQAEYDNGKLKIFGSYTHIAEALIRAAWAEKDKSLNIWAA